MARRDSPITDVRPERLEGRTLWVVPRFGTISPWSPKATDIAQLCGLAEVARIERGIAYTIAGPISDEASARALLHDRMTESVLDRVEAAELLFARSDPKPLRTVSVLAEGKAALESANRSMGLALAADEIDYLVDAVFNGALSNTATYPINRVTRRVIAVLISIPIWLLIVLLSPLDAYSAAKTVTKQI